MIAVKLDQVRQHLRHHAIAGWLLYDFRGQNPIAASVAGLENTGTRRWFLWIPAEGEPEWLVHAIEQAAFSTVPPELAGPLHLYVGWQEIEEKLRRILPHGSVSSIAMEYSPSCAIPYVSKVDAGTLELVQAASRATVVSSADLVQLVQAVLSTEQIESHRRAAAHMLAAKDAAFAFVDAALRAGQEITEYAVQQLIVNRFRDADLEWDHDPIVAVNSNAALPHYAPSARQHSPVRRGDALLIDPLGQGTELPRRLLRPISPVDRLLRPGAAPGSDARLRSGRASARRPAVAAIRQGLDNGQTVHGYEIDDAARRVIEEAGFGRGILHRTGHSLGPHHTLERRQHRQR